MDKRKKDVKRIVDDFSVVFDSSEYVARRKKMDRHLNLYKGQMWNSKTLDSDDSEIMANFIFSIVQSTAPLLTDNKPVWHCRARDANMQGVADMYTRAGDYLWDSLDMDHEQYLVTKDALIWPVGLHKLHFDKDADEIKIETDDPRTFAISPGYDDIRKCAWCGTKTIRPISWVRQEFPDAKDLDELSKEVGRNDDEDSLDKHGVSVYEIWLKDDTMEEYMVDATSTGEEPKKQQRKKYPKGRIITCTDKTTLRDEASPFDHGWPPWVPFYNYKVPHDFWGMGEPEQIETLNLELNKRLQTVVAYANSNQKPNYVTDISSGIEPEDLKRRLKKGGEVIGVNPGMVETAIRAIEEGDLNPSHLQLLMILPDLIQRISGITDVSQGIVGKKERQSASELSILIESSYTRTRQRIRNHEWSLRREFEMIVRLMQQFYDTARPIPYKQDGERGTSYISNTPAMALEASAPVRPEDMSDREYVDAQMNDPTYQEAVKMFGGDKNEPVHFNFDIEIQTNSTLPTDKQAKANLMMQLANVRIAPDSVISARTILNAFQLDTEEMMREKQEEMGQMMALQQRQGAQQQ